MTLEEIKKRLEQSYPDAHPETGIKVFDLTGTQDHWEVMIESAAFQGLSKIQQHQHVMSQFGPELKSGEVHALSIKTVVK